VKAAIHVKSTIKWQICSAKINSNYIHDITDMVPIYRSLIGNGTRVLVYSGDTDAAVPFTDTQYWISYANYLITPIGLLTVVSFFRQLLNQPVQSLWKPWYLNNQVAGFVSQYTGLTFVTVKGAGHMVPQTKPPQALKMFTSFLAGIPLK